MDLTPVKELSLATGYVEERAKVGIVEAGALLGEEGTETDKDTLMKQQLEKENEELRLMCGHLGEAYHRSRQLEMEWQSFGRYTAEILKEELASSESRSRVTREELDRLAKENKDLKEMCLFLDQFRDGREEASSLTPPEAMELMLHGRVAGEVNRVLGQIPRYTGKTEHTTLKDSEAIRVGVMSERNKELALTEMKKRLERLEIERLELVKSLSAAHTLAADSAACTRGKEADGRDTLPAHLQQQLDNIMDSGSARKDGNATATVSTDVIQNAVTLLDVVRRLDATTASGFSDGVVEGEVLVLRLLVNIAWQKIQESLNMKNRHQQIRDKKT